MIKNLINVGGISLDIIGLVLIATPGVLLRHGFKQVELSPESISWA